MLMSIKKSQTSRLKNTLNELDSALEQWDSITNKPAGEQARSDSPVQQRAKSLLQELRDQLNEFENMHISSEEESNLNK